MAVRRRALGKSPSAEIVKLELGRVLITVDDLAALVEMVKSRERPVVIEYAGGTLDEPTDLQDLKPLERESLTVRTSELEVVLSTRAAYVVSSPEVADWLVELWARPRQTRLRPPIRPRDLSRIDVVIAALLAVDYVAILLFNLLSTDPPALFRVNLNEGTSAWIAVAGQVVMWSSMCYHIAYAPHYAVIEGVGSDRFDEKKLQRRSHRQNFLVAFVSLLVAIAALIISIVK